jgi:hypothetical protein
VLTTDTETPVVTETAVGADLLQALEILTVLAVEAVGEDLVVLAVDDVALSVEEPAGDLVLGGALEDGDDTLQLFGGEFTGTVNRSLVVGSLSLTCLVVSVCVCALCGNFLWFPECIVRKGGGGRTFGKRTAC